MSYLPSAHLLKFDLQLVLLNRSFSGCESNVDKFGSDGVVPNVLSPGCGIVQITSTTVAESLVDNIPGITAVAKVFDEIGHMVDKDGAQSLVCPSSGGEPLGELIVPVEVMASHNSPLGCRDLEELVGQGVVEHTLLGFLDQLADLLGGRHTQSN